MKTIKYMSLLIISMALTACENPVKPVRGNNNQSPIDGMKRFLHDTWISRKEVDLNGTVRTEVDTLEIDTTNSKILREKIRITVGRIVSTQPFTITYKDKQFFIHIEDAPATRYIGQEITKGTLGGNIYRIEKRDENTIWLHATVSTSPVWKLKRKT